MKEKLSKVYDVLQKLDIKPTPNSVAILDWVYTVLREIYEEVEEQEHGRTAADPERQPED